MACGNCAGHCTNGAECAVSQFLGKPLDWRPGRLGDSPEPAVS